MVAVLLVRVRKNSVWWEGNNAVCNLCTLINKLLQSPERNLRTQWDTGGRSSAVRQCSCEAGLSMPLLGGYKNYSRLSSDVESMGFACHQGLDPVALSDTEAGLSNGDLLHWLYCNVMR